MSSYTSTLTMRLIDGVTGPARGVHGALRDVDATARGIAGGRGGMASFLAGGGKLLAMAGGGYAAARTVRQAITDYAALDRAMTRVAITADASEAQQAAATAGIRRLANETGMAIDDALAAVETLVAQGKSLPQAMSLLPAIMRTAQASGAASEDIAGSARAVADAFGIASSQMENAFDIMAGGGKAGMFELKDMAQYLPSLAPAMAALGYQGETGLKKLVAMLQIARSQTGESSEAVTNIANVLQKMETDETAKKFGKFGVDVRKELDLARASGKDLIDVYLDLTEKAIKGDLSKIPLLFTDAQMQKGMRALIMQRKELEALYDELGSVQGTVAKDFDRVFDDPTSRIQRLQNAWDTFLVSLGSAADASGVVSAITEVAEALNNVAGIIDDIQSDGLLKALLDGDKAGGLFHQAINTPASTAYRNAYRDLAGEEPTASDQAKWLLPWSDPGKAEAAARMDAWRRRYPGMADGYAEQAARSGFRFRPDGAVDTTAETIGGNDGIEPDWTLDGRPGFRPRGAIGPSATPRGSLADPDAVLPDLIPPGWFDAADAFFRRLPGEPMTPAPAPQAPPPKPQPGEVPLPRPRPGRDALPARMDEAPTRAPARPAADLMSPEPIARQGGMTRADEERILRGLDDFYRSQGQPPRFFPDAVPASPAGGPGRPEAITLPEVKAPRQDLSGAAAETMGTFRAGLESEIASVDAVIDAAVSRWRSKLSISASPSINATVTTTQRTVASASPASAAATSQEMGREASARLNRADGDQSYA